MTLPDLVPGTRDAWQWMEMTHWVRRWAWTYALAKVRGDSHERVNVPDALANCAPVINRKEEPDWDAFGLWAEEAHRHLIDDGPVEQVMVALRDTKAVTLFWRQVNATRGRYVSIQTLARPGEPVLRGALPAFRGLVPPACHLRWDAAQFTALVVTGLKEPAESA